MKFVLNINANVCTSILILLLLQTLEKNVNKVLSFGPDILLAVPRALLTSKLSGYVNKALFGKKKEAAPAPAQQAPVVAQAQESQRPVLDSFKGGTK